MVSEYKGAMTNQKSLLERADRLFPGGVLGGHRSAPGLEFVVKDARGPYLWDADGRRYIDYLLGSGPMLLGHAHPAVVGAVQRQLSHGAAYMLLNEPGIELAEELGRPVQWCEQGGLQVAGRGGAFLGPRRRRRQRGPVQ